MRTAKRLLPLLAVLLATALVWANSLQRYLHVKVMNPTTHELVRVNVPLSLAEKVIPAINHGQLQNGKIQCGNFTADKVNIRAILDAVRTAPDGEFVTVQEPDNDLRVAKERGQLIVQVVDKHGKENVDVTVPWDVAEALISDTKADELNIEAAIQALQTVGDFTLVTVSGGDESVRIWIDANAADK
jgi:hypothetical protein